MAQIYYEDAREFYMGTTEFKEITQEDVDTFARCTGDHNPIHVDDERVNKDSFVWKRVAKGKKIVHGMLTISTVVGLLDDFNMIDGMLLPEIRGIKFLKPVWPGNKIYGALHVIERKDPESRTLKRYMGELVCHLEVFNQDREQVADMQIHLLAERRNPLNAE